MQLCESALVVEQKNYLTKIVNACIVYDLDNWPRNRLNKSILKNCLFGATNIVKNSDKNKYLYICYGIAFDGAGSWSSGNEFAGNDIFFVLITVHHLILIIARIFF